MWEPTPIGFQCRLHEWSLGIMARLVVTASLVLLGNQASSSVGLRRGSQFNPRKLGLASVLYGANRTVLTNLEAMRLELATLSCHATEFMQVPNASSNLIHRADRDNGSVVGDVVANHSLEHACLCMVGFQASMISYVS